MHPLQNFTSNKLGRKDDVGDAIASAVIYEDKAAARTRFGNNLVY